MADLTISRQSISRVNDPNAFRGVDIEEGISVDEGAPVLLFDEVRFCQANALATSNCSGLALSAGEKPGSVDIKFAGPMTLRTDQWDNITGQVGGLTPHSTYYISAATAGKLTATPPSNPNYIAPIGFALSATTMMIQIPGNPQQASP